MKTQQWLFVLILLVLVSVRPASHALAQPTSPLAEVPGWRQSNVSGFGNPGSPGVDALEMFNGYLYAGSTNYGEGATLWHTPDGVTWSAVISPGFGSAYTNTNALVYDLLEFNGQLYAGAGFWSNDGVGGQIWRSPNGVNWTAVESDGFGETDNAAITTLGIFSNTLYAATGGHPNGVQIWRSSTGDLGSWTRVITDGNGDLNNRWVTGFAVLNGYLYAAIETTITSSVQIWQTNDGVSWTQTNISGFGDMDNDQTGGMAVLDGYLYVGTRNDVTGAQIWRSNNGTTWTQAMGDGFGDINTFKVEALAVFDSYLYAVADNNLVGLQVWRSADGTTWDKTAPDGFGQPQNVGTLWSNATAVFNNNLFVGTTNNIEGGQVWQTVNQVYLPFIRR